MERTQKQSWRNVFKLWGKKANWISIWSEIHHVHSISDQIEIQFAFFPHNLNTFLQDCFCVLSTECSPGSYGQDCIETCGHCKQKAPCEHDTGHCPSAACDDGFAGQLCKGEQPKEIIISSSQLMLLLLFVFKPIYPVVHKHDYWWGKCWSKYRSLEASSYAQIPIRCNQDQAVK